VASSPTSVSVKDAGGSGNYTTSFPDSTKGTANPSPPFGMSTNAFGFAPSLGSGFSDLSKRQFLNPQLHVVERSGRRSKKQDLYRRLEARLKAKSSQEGISKTPDKPFAHQKSAFSDEQDRLKNNFSIGIQKF
jgi:hypothetical protein